MLRNVVSCLLECVSGKRAATSEVCGNVLTVTDPRTEQAEPPQNYFHSFHGHTLKDETTSWQALTLKDASLPSTSPHRDKFSVQHINPLGTHSQPYLNHGKYFKLYWSQILRAHLFPPFKTQHSTRKIDILCKLSAVGPRLLHVGNNYKENQ